MQQENNTIDAPEIKAKQVFISSFSINNLLPKELYLLPKTEITIDGNNSFNYGQYYIGNVDCGSGTYIRTLTNDLSKSLNTVSHLVFLERTRQGQFLLENSIPFNFVKEFQGNTNILDVVTKAIRRF